MLVGLVILSHAPNTHICRFARSFENVKCLVRTWNPVTWNVNQHIEHSTATALMLCIMTSCSHSIKKEVLALVRFVCRTWHSRSWYSPAQAGVLFRHFRNYPSVLVRIMSNDTLHNERTCTCAAPSIGLWFSPRFSLAPKFETNQIQKFTDSLQNSK